jgi:ADP-ribosylglycohydrolase
MSSTGNCFDIGAATKNSLVEFERRQKEFAKKHKIPIEQIDYLSDDQLLKEFNVYCSEDGVAGNGALMRLAPIPLFFYRHPIVAVEYSGQSGKITHGDKKAYDACRYYGALIVAAVNGESRDELLDRDFYENHKDWFGETSLDREIMNIAHGSYQRKEGYAGGIRGKGYIVSALEAALWAFWSNTNSFKDGALAAVNLGDDADTTAAIYGQLAGAYYGYQNLRKEWKQKVYAKRFIECLSQWIVYEGEKWSQQRPSTSPKPTKSFNPRSGKNKNKKSKPPTEDSDTKFDSSSEPKPFPVIDPANRLRRKTSGPEHILKLQARKQFATDGPESPENPESKQTTGHIPISNLFFLILSISTYLYPIRFLDVTNL